MFHFKSRAGPFNEIHEFESIRIIFMINKEIYINVFKELSDHPTPRTSRIFLRFFGRFWEVIISIFLDSRIKEKFDTVSLYVVPLCKTLNLLAKTNVLKIK